MAKSSKRKKAICKVGDRLQDSSNRWGTVVHDDYTPYFPYKIKWDNGHEDIYKEDEFKLHKYTIHPPEPAAEDVEEEDLAQLDLNFSRGQDLNEHVDTMLKVIQVQLGEIVKSDLKKLDAANLIKAWYPDLTPEQIEEVRLRIYAALPKSKSLFAVLESSEELDLDFSREQEWKVGDRCRVINPNAPESVTAYEWTVDGFTTATSLSGDLNLVIIKREVEPRGFTTRSFESKWLKLCSDNLTSAQELASDSHLQDFSSEDLPLLVYANRMSIAETFSQSDTLASLSMKMSSTQEIGVILEQSKQISLQLHHHVSRSVSKVKGSEPTTKETVSPQLLKRSPKSNQSTSRSKTLKVCSVALTDLDLECDILPESSPNFPSAGTMQNGKWLPADTLTLPSLESGSYWLESPGALSSDMSRAPGLSRLESQLKANGILEKGECVNPRFLEKVYQLPLGWTNPLECRSATQLLVAEEKPSEIALIQELQHEHSDESCISTISLKSEEELTPVDDSAIGKHFWCDRLTVAVEVLSLRNWRESLRSPVVKGANTRPWWTKEFGKTVFPETLVVPLTDLQEIEKFSSPYVVGKDDIEKKSLEKSESRQIGSLYHDIEWRTNKAGEKIQYPRVDGERDPENDDHWYWYISYVVRDSNHKKSSRKAGGWKDTTAYVPRKNLSLCRELMREQFPVELTVEVCQIKWLWSQRRGDYLIGESKPDACPRLVVVDFQEKQLFISSSEWGELTPAKRHTKQRLIGEAIAAGKPLTYIKEVVANQ